jgi:hypothetical protein
MKLSGSKRSFIVEPIEKHGSRQWKITIKHSRKDVVPQFIGFYPSKELAQRDVPIVTIHMDVSGLRAKTFRKNLTETLPGWSSSSYVFSLPKLSVTQFV